MTDHGELDDADIPQVLGEMVIRMVDQLKFAPGANALTGFAIDDVQYELTIKVKPS